MGPMMLVHKLVPWWLFCEDFMHSKEIRFGAVATLIKHAFTGDKVLMREGCYKR